MQLQPNESLHSWKFDFDDNIWSTPIFVTSADHKILFVASYGGTIASINAINGSMNWSKKLGHKISAGIKYIDSIHAIVVCTHGGSVVAYNIHSGEEIWSINTGGIIRSSPLVADVDNDGQLEIVIASYGLCIECVEGSTGRSKWKFKGTSPLFLKRSFVDSFGGIVSSPAMITDKHGQSILIVGSRAKRIYALNGKDGKFIWARRFPYGFDSTAAFAPVESHIAAIIGSGESLNGKGANSLYALDCYSGQVLWKSTLGGGIDCPITIRKNNDTGSFQAFCSSLANATVHCISIDNGKTQWSSSMGPTPYCKHSSGSCLPLSCTEYHTDRACCRSYTKPILHVEHENNSHKVTIANMAGNIYEFNADTGSIESIEPFEAPLRATPLFTEISTDQDLHFIRIVCSGRTVTSKEFSFYKAVDNPVVHMHDFPKNLPCLRRLFSELSFWAADLYDYTIYKLDKLLQHFGIKLCQYIF